MSCGPWARGGAGESGPGGLGRPDRQSHRPSMSTAITSSNFINFNLAHIGIIAKQQGGHVQTASNTFGTSGVSVSHLGTGKSFERKNSGLKSFEA